MSTVETCQGAVEGSLANDILQFLGVPYAAPACLASNRFQPPRPAQKRAEKFEAFDLPACPPQIDPTLAPQHEPKFPGQHADILTLNIWKPEATRHAKLPVLVYIHGGSYLFGSGNHPLYRGHSLAAKNVVVVTLSYRTGFEGFGHIPGQPDNRGLLDQIAALEWVRDNIAGFGGDPANVTAAGQSAGAGSILCLLAMPAAHGLFRRAILHSAVASILSLETARKVAKTLATNLRVEPTLEGFSSVPPQALAMAGMALAAAATSDPASWGPLAFTSTPIFPVADGEVLPHPPLLPLDPYAADIDILVGYCKDEYAGFADSLPGLKADPEIFTQAIGHQVLTEMEQQHPDAKPKELFSELASDWLFRVPCLRTAAHHAMLRAQSASSPASGRKSAASAVSTSSAGASASTQDTHAAKPSTQHAGDDRSLTVTSAAPLTHLPHQDSPTLGTRNSAASQTHCFEFAGIDPRRPDAPISHTADMPYAFGTLDAMYRDIQTIAPPRSPDVEELSERMQDAWVSFCRCGNPKWGCSDYETSSPIQRVWTLPDEEGKQKKVPNTQKLWGGYRFSPLDVPSDVSNS